MKKQTVDSIAKKNLVYGEIVPKTSKITKKQRDALELRKLAQQIFADQLEREQSDKLWLYLSYGLGLFILGYMVYHFIRFLMM